MPESVATTPPGASSVVALASPLAPGDHVGAYRIESVIQHGGMGEVFLVSLLNDSTASPVVLKRLPLHSDDEDNYVGMFRAEIEVMSRLRHPNIVSVLDSFETESELCLALEFVRGRNLLQLQRACSEQRVTVAPGVGIHIVVQVLEGLHHAHNLLADDGRPLGLVHRDVTPGNILVGFEGTTKITDFGIAKSALSTVKTRVGVVKGTTRYLSPEQIRARAVTPQSDVFSAAVVLTELLTGQPLFDRGAVAPTLFAIVNRERPDISTLLPFDAPELSMILEQALDADPTRRPATARAFADGLRWAAQAQGWTEAEDDLHALMKRLFPEAESAPDAVPATIKASAPRLDLTYLLEVSDQEPWSGAGPAPVEEELRALLQGMISGAAPLDASQFASPATPIGLVAVRSNSARGTPTPKTTVAVAERDTDSRMLAMTVSASRASSIGGSKPPPVPPPDDVTTPPEGQSILDALDSVSSEIDALDVGADGSDGGGLEGLTVPGANVKRASRWPRDALMLILGLGLGFGIGHFVPIVLPSLEMLVADFATPAKPPTDEPKAAAKAAVAKAAAATKARPTKGSADPDTAPVPPKPDDSPAAPPADEKKVANEAATRAPPESKPVAKKKSAAKKDDVGYLTITRPRGARVYLDGNRLLGRVPYRKIRVKTGRRLVKIRKRRYLRVFEMDVTAGVHLNATGGRIHQVDK